MNLMSMILSTIALLVQKYADYDKETNYRNTLADLKDDLNFPKITTYDFIVGNYFNQKKFAQRLPRI